MALSEVEPLDELHTTYYEHSWSTCTCRER